MVRKLLAKQAEQMDIINNQKEQQQAALDQLMMLKQQNEHLMDKVDHPDQSLIEDMMKKQNEQSEAFKHLMEVDSNEKGDLKENQEKIYNEMVKKQKEQEEHIANLIKKLDKEKESKDNITKDAISQMEKQLKNAMTQNNIVKDGLKKRITGGATTKPNPIKPKDFSSSAKLANNVPNSVKRTANKSPLKEAEKVAKKINYFNI